MKQGDEYNKDFTDKPNSSSEDEKQETRDWRNEHGQPDFAYLQALATDGSIEALEKLKGNYIESYPRPT